MGKSKNKEDPLMTIQRKRLHALNSLMSPYYNAFKPTSVHVLVFLLFL